jgi:hypothetical protein
VLVAAVKSNLVLHLRVVIFFWSFGITDFNTLVLMIENGGENGYEMLHFELSLINILNKTESAVLNLLFF